MTEAQQPKPATEKKVHPNKAAFDELAEHFSELINLEAPKPLKIGIHEELAATEKMSKTKIRRGLSFYVHQFNYIKAVSEGGERHGLHGTDGEVSEEDQSHAKNRIEEIIANRKERQQQRKQAQVRKKKAAEKSDRINNKLNDLVSHFNK